MQGRALSRGLLISVVLLTLQSATVVSEPTFNFTSVDHRVYFDDLNDITTYHINFTIRWQVVGDDLFDGFSYKIQDKDELSASYIGSPGVNFPKQFGRKKSCNQVEGKNIWRSVQNKTILLHTIPGSDLSDELCSALNEANGTLHPLERSKTFQGRFGRTYEFTLMSYKLPLLIGGRSVETTPVFCREHMIENYGFPYAEVNDFCQLNQTISGLNLPTGPPANLRNYNMSYDLETNRGTVVFRWESPYDASDEVNVTSFDIVADIADKNKTKIVQNQENDYFTAVVSGILLGKEGHVTVTPRLHCRRLDNICSDHGQPKTIAFSIPDIDACYRNGSYIRYCDDNAECTDLAATYSTSATCHCSSGYTGNGINLKLNGGEGCIDIDSCLYNDTCDVEAYCVDLPPPSTTSNCSCQPYFVGDGYLDGSGCRSLSLLLGTGICIPLGALMLTACLIFAWRKKVRTREAIELKFSKFAESFKSAPFDYNTDHDFDSALNAKDNPVIVIDKKWEIDRNQIEMQEVLGRGSFGVVYAAKLCIGSEEKAVAIKTCPEILDKSRLISFLNEVALMSTIGYHENVMNMIGCCTADSKPYYLITQLMKYGDLLHFLWDAREVQNRDRDQTFDLTQKNMYEIAAQVANGMEYLYEKKIIHGDLAARNILVGEGMQCKISDFGLASDVYCYGEIRNVKESLVPIKWVSPERMLSGRVPVTWQSDVWSFGILLYEIVTLGGTPYPEIASDKLFQTLRSGWRMQRPATCDHVLYEIMLKCWKWTPMQRPSFKELCNAISASASCLHKSTTIHMEESQGATASTSAHVQESEIIT